MTLCGQSAGGLCVSYHTLSPQSRGLFSAAITQSGIFTVPYFKLDRHPAYYARKVVSYYSVGSFLKGTLFFLGGGGRIPI